MYCKRIIPDPEYPSSVIQWEDQVKQTEPSYEFKDLTRDSTESKIIESANVKVLDKENRNMKGIVRIIKTGGLYYVTHIVTYENYWDKLSPDIARIFDSIEIVE